MIVSRADLSLPASPEEVMYLTPPMMMKMTAIKPAIRMIWEMISVIKRGRSSFPETLHPAAFLTDSGAELLQTLE